MKKIYDIVPPGKADSVLRPREITKEREVKIKRKFPFKLFFIILIGTIVYVFFMDGHSVVTIYPKINQVSGEETITVTLKQGAVDLENKIVPSIIFPNVQDVSENYTATGKSDKDVKAKGTIRVLNKLNPAKSLSLIKGTRFLDESGDLIYKAISGFTIPAAKTIDGKFTPGFVDIEVEADEAGERYNISSAIFSVPGLSGTEYFSSIYGEVKSPFIGGFKSEVSVVLAKDLELAEETFKEKFTNKSREDLKNSIPSNYIYNEQEFITTFENIVLGAKVKDEVASFTVSGKVKTEVEAYRKEDVMGVLESIVGKQTSETIIPDGLTYTQTESKTKDDNLELKVSYSAKTYWLPDNDFLLQSILGKDKNYSLSLLQNIPEVDRAEINLQPFFKTKNPNNKENVEIKLNFNQ
jgi:hypothetical protein